MCREIIQTEMIRNSTDPIAKFNETVIAISDETIPNTSTNPKHPGNPWFPYSKPYSSVYGNLI
jgi:hypothetical protein